MAAIEPQSAAEYDDRTTVAVRSVLIEIGQTLGSPALGGRTADLWQQDAFGQVDAWLTELDLG